MWYRLACIYVWLFVPCSLLAMASCAREYNYSRPQLTNSNVIIIKAGRFVLLLPIIDNNCYY